MLTFKNRFNLSLSNEYFMFITIVLFLVCMLSAIFYIYSYHLYVEQKKSSLLRSTKLVSAELTNILRENENILKFFGLKIIERFDYKNINNISNLLISSLNLNIKSMTKSYISWANQDGVMVVSGKIGVLKHNNPNIKHRSYFTSAQKYPWTLQISVTDKSLFSQNRILPTAMGIKNYKNNEFVGYLVLGLHIEHINQHMKDLTTTELMNYIVLYEDYTPIFSSMPLNDTNYLINKNKELLSSVNFINNTIIPIQIFSEANKIKYSYVTKVPNYPFFILTGYDLNAYKQDFLNKVTARLGEFLFIGIFCITLLYIFKKRIILPISTLANIAIAISNGNLKIKIPKQHSAEMFNLAKGLLLVIKYIKKNNIYKQQLELSNKIITDSEQAKSEFVKKITYTFGSYLKEIFIYIHFINKYFQENKFANDKIIQYSQKIEELINLINTKTSNFLELTNFDLTDIIKQAIQINMKLSFIKKISILDNYESNMPNIYADELQIKQALISLLRQSIENSPNNSQISIHAFSYLDKNQSIWFGIIIQDESFCLNDEMLENMEENFCGRMDLKMFEFTAMKIKDIEKIISMHQGKLIIENKLHLKGRKIKLSLPLLFPEKTNPCKDNIVKLHS